MKSHDFQTYVYLSRYIISNFKTFSVIFPSPRVWVIGQLCRRKTKQFGFGDPRWVMIWEGSTVSFVSSTGKSKPGAMHSRIGVAPLVLLICSLVTAAYYLGLKSQVTQRWCFVLVVVLLRLPLHHTVLSAHTIRLMILCFIPPGANISVWYRVQVARGT